MVPYSVVGAAMVDELKKIAAVPSPGAAKKLWMAVNPRAKAQYMEQMAQRAAAARKAMPKAPVEPMQIPFKGMTDYGQML
jgi:hypothetical protein